MRPPLDRDELRAMFESPAWKAYEARLAEMLEQARTDCERPGPDIALHQGRVRALRSVIGLPDILLKECKR